jgi:hypothetical protein
VDYDDNIGGRMESGKLTVTGEVEQGRQEGDDVSLKTHYSINNNNNII